MAKCENPSGCKNEATRGALLHVSNPDANNPEGEQRRVLTCELHADTWTGLWGSWPLKPDTSCPHNNPECVLTDIYCVPVLHSRCADCANPACNSKVQALGARFCSACMSDPSVR